MAPHRTRDGLTVCLIGPECTGKTTLAQQLAAHFGAPWVPEFVREYASRARRPLTVADVEPIAKGEIALLDVAAADDGLLILDTDLFSTVVYSRHYYGACPEWIVAEAVMRQADLYLLTGIDVPWSGDDVRDSAETRPILHRAFASALDALNARVVEISGSVEDRFAAAVKEIGHAETRRRGES
ncbi:MAG TPA: ATP-binding protein [Thermoanaerobaculia bacterium]|nr:ATP-binding protein [Thermoanaerobaculia bacterium]